MKILLVHNYYGSSAPSGENTAYEAEKKLLKNHGHTVIEFTKHSDEIRDRGLTGMIIGALSTPWNPFSLRALKKLLIEEKPEVMHVHNTFPLLSPSIFYAAKGLKTATVLTLHNYRIFCAAAIPTRKNQICTECLDSHSVYPALKYGCYRNSKSATLPLVAKIALHRKLKTWANHVDAFVALTGFHRKALAQAGLPLERIHIKPHFYPYPPDPIPWTERDDKAVFIGRLSEEKGVEVLLKAWRPMADEAPRLEIIGDGPEREKLSASIKGTSLENRIAFSGQLPFAGTQKRLARARMLIVPSLCFEGFPMVIREAFALGVPVIASRIGSLPDIVTDNKNGLLFEAGNAAELQGVVKQAFKDSDTLQSMSAAARQEFEKKYTVIVNLETLMDIYERAIEHKRNKPGAP